MAPPPPHHTKERCSSSRSIPRAPMNWASSQKTQDRCAGWATLKRSKKREKARKCAHWSLHPAIAHRRSASPLPSPIPIQSAQAQTVHRALLPFTVQSIPSPISHLPYPHPYPYPRTPRTSFLAVGDRASAQGRFSLVQVRIPFPFPFPAHPNPTLSRSLIFHPF